MPGAQRAGGRDRGSGRRAGAAPAAHARDHRADVGGGDGTSVEMPERDVVKTITDFAPLWDELFPAEQARIVRLLVERVDLASDGMQVRLRAEGLQTLVEELQAEEARRHESDAWSPAQNWEFDGKTITVRIPMTWKRRGGRKVIIAPDGGDAWAPAKPRPDETLIRALARAHRWKRVLEEGRYRSAGELAEAEGVTRSFVNRLLRLTLLAPDIQEAILEGRQPKAMQLEELTDAIPSEWEKQRTSVRRRL